MANQLMRGALKSPRHKLLAAHPHTVIKAPPPQWAWIPQKLDMWGNDQYGDCVTAEEAFAKATYQPEIFIPTATVTAWASKHGVLNGADLSQVMDMMQNDGFVVGSQQYNDGKYSGVDYSNETVLQSAISQGPVKIAIDANALPSGAGNNQGWYSLGHGNFPNTDHCVALCGYGPAGWLYQQLGVPLPSALSASQPGYLLYTWSTIGFVDHKWIMSTCVEAWVRNPTTVGVPPLTPPVPPTPPTPPTPPVPPAPGTWPTALPASITFNTDGTFVAGGGTGWNVDMSKLPQLINDFLAFLNMPVPPMVRQNVEIGVADYVSSHGSPVGKINFLKLIQIAMLVFGWFSSGADPTKLVALIQQIMAI